MGKKKGWGESNAEGPLLFELDPEPIEEKLTALGGVSLLLQAIRSLDVGGRTRRRLHVKKRRRGFDEAEYVESFIVLNAVGGECLEDFERLREDPGLAEMMGHEAPSAEAARTFLYQFHDEELVAQAQAGRGGQGSWLVEESEPLEALGEVCRETVREIGLRCRNQKIATVDLDATIIASTKREAQPTYQGGKGYQPQLALWAEMDLILAEEFRDGNVPAGRAPLPVAQRAFEALPETVQERYFRGDSACCERELLDWLRDENRAIGPQGRIGFAVSAPMTAPLKQAILDTPPEWWQPYRDDATAELSCAPIPYNPEEKARVEREPLRWTAIRVRRRQGELFDDGSREKYFAVVSNIWDWSERRLLEWQRQKAGTIEAAHDVLKNELGGGVMPCGRFGANAAWLRLAALSYNVLSALKRLALPAELLTARPKRLRFLIFHTPGKLTHHARRVKLRLVRTWNRFSNWRWAFQSLPTPALVPT